MKITQTDKILEVLKDGRYHSSLEFRNEHFIMQPATRIFELKEEGHKIDTAMMPCIKGNQESAKIAWYKLIPRETLF